ncbi:DMT family transporter [Arcobacter sp. LA11]|uniref:DMT family transporter n=1 Tax=Arcobacter sp. LA11 TaxID=1898176 RepID=UPI000933535F|nr:DMT family transporter [Arcobacter sp. LA11]
MTNTNKNIFYILLFFAMIGWGGSWVNIKILSNYLNEFETMFFRFFITAITMIPIILILRKSFKINLKAFFFVILTSIAMITYMKYFYLGTKFGTASLGGAFVTSLIPINTFLIMAILGSKKISKKDSFALALGAIGVMTMLNVWSFKSEEIFVIHNLYFILASVLWPLVTILSSKATKVSPIVFTLYLYIVTCILNLIFFVDLTTIEYEKLDSLFWINMLCLSIVASTFANTIYFLGVEKLGASEVSTFIFLVPFAAITLSAIFLKEEVTFSIIIGTILTIIAVKILNNIKILKK